SLTGEPAGPPTKSGLSLVDYCGGLVAGIAVVSGVHAARRDGVGLDCDLSLFDVAISLLTYLATWHLNSGYEPRRMPFSAHPSLVPFQNFETADGWIVVGCAKEKFWRRLADAIGRSDLAEDPRFATFGDRREHADDLLPILADAFLADTSEAWLSRLGAAGVPCGPVNDMAAALADEQTIARGLLISASHPRFGEVMQLASPVRVGDPPQDHRRAPLRGEHRDDVLTGLLGYAPSRVRDLESRGAFTVPGPVGVRS
ncbi:MAG TPA: CoA transferase, partial [Actinomycetota bacterium]